MSNEILSIRRHYRIRTCVRTFIKPRFTGSRRFVRRDGNVAIVLSSLTARFLFDFHFKGGLIARNRGESSVLADPAPRANIFIRSLKSHSDVRAGDAAVPRPRPLEILSSSPVNRKVGSFAFVRINRTMHGARLPFATDSRGPPSRTNGFLHFPFLSSSSSSPFHRLLRRTSSVWKSIWLSCEILPTLFIYLFNNVQLMLVIQRDEVSSRKKQIL